MLEMTDNAFVGECAFAKVVRTRNGPALLIAGHVIEVVGSEHEFAELIARALRESRQEKMEDERAQEQMEDATPFGVEFKPNGITWIENPEDINGEANRIAASEPSEGEDSGGPHRYSVYEIDEMRCLVKDIMCSEIGLELPEISDATVENRLRTYMLQGATSWDLRARLQTAGAV